MLRYLKSGYSNKSKKIINSYDEIINLAKKRDYLKSEESDLLKEIRNLKLRLDSYSEIFSDADEFEVSYDYLLNELDDRNLRLEYLKEEITKIENRI